jgi:acyl carrier protein
MVPEEWTVTDRLPTDINGKRLRNPAAREAAEPIAEPVADSPADSLADTVRAEWSAVLGTDDIPHDASFFDLGGHSLTVIKLLGRIERKLGVRLALSDFFDAPTVEGNIIAVEAARVGTAQDRVRGRL